MRKDFLIKIVNNKLALASLIFITLLILTGLFAPLVSPNDPYLVNLENKLLSFSLKYPLGTDHLGRCVASRLIYGIRTTLFYSLFAMFITVFFGLVLGLLASFFKLLRVVILRFCDIMLSFPSELMMLAIIGFLGTGIENIIIAAIISKVAWYTRMIYSFTLNHVNTNYIHFSKIIGIPSRTIIKKHLFPLILSDIIMLATLNVGSIILSISALSFLGLGVQAPTCEWGIMLNEAKELMSINPYMMLPPGLMILFVVLSFNILADSIRDILDPTYNLKIKDNS
ncbi:nickel ABC transporter, permease protein [Malaciobacter marinus]|uniref:Nickel ABC transporter permease subunit NikC n=1 Tax=Malaciobacter marinus TaxID=505249 RepID=A0A347TIU5_9BACT|nr:nickel/cobalt ABC transporter permease [Malaciobacter marinus]AXX86523.1 nickel ABC transporter, permease protein [Malaciobacter marinus]PHO14208.1 nickel ABC transporter permease subunit NikC [Malaciobacter marinus]